MRRLERGRAGQRAQELDALRRREQLDAEDVRGVGDHRLQAARRERGHRDVVFLVGRGRQRIDAGRVGERLVLAGQRRRRDVGDHEAAVEARRRVVRNGGSRDTPASISIAMRRSAIAPTSAIATAIASAANATGSAWKLPPRRCCHRAVFAREDQRVVGHRVGLAHQHQRGMAQLVEAGAHHLRLAAQAVRVLHPVVALEVRAADRAALEQRAVVARDVDLPRLAAQRVDARIERAVAAARRIDRQRADDERRLEHRLERQEARAARARSRPACR